MLPTSNYENPAADPMMVDKLVDAMGRAVNETIIIDVTTTADILSALFTMLDVALQIARKDTEGEDAAWNAKEISRVLMDFLMEYGTATSNPQLAN